MKTSESELADVDCIVSSRGTFASDRSTGSDDLGRDVLGARAGQRP